MASENYYKILHVPSDASQEVIKKAYYSLCLQWHPDKNPGSTEAERVFKCISRAYDTLSDPQKRRAYDLTLFETTRDETTGFSTPGGIMEFFIRDGFEFGDMISTSSGINGQPGGIMEFFTRDGFEFGYMPSTSSGINGQFNRVLRERTVIVCENGCIKTKSIRQFY